jgi:protein associated with RNAse G/E
MAFWHGVRECERRSLYINSTSRLLCAKTACVYYDYDCRSYRNKTKRIVFSKATNEMKRINIITVVNPHR